MGATTPEAKFQAKLIRKLNRMFPGCVVLKNDPGYKQGILDLTILWGPLWAMLEVKASPNARRQPNQDHYVNRANEMSFGAIIYPENEEEVLAALESTFASRGAALVSQS